MSRELWAITSDLHCGSTLGLCPPEGVQLDDGGRYLPSKAQSALWECWLSYWAAVRLERKPGDKLIVAWNGDVVDGSHHQTSQIVTTNLPATQHEIALAVMRPALDLAPDSVVLIRGTEAHVGGSAAYEERLARDIGAVPCPETGASSHWHFQADSQGVLLDFAHHGRLGSRPWTKMTGPGTLAAQIVMAAAKHRTQCPNVAIRSHYHQWADSADNFATRVVQIAGWQLSTAFVHRIAAGALPEVGGILIGCEAGEYELQKVKFDWKRGAPWKLKDAV